MALHYTRKKEETPAGKEIPAEEFFNLMIDNKRVPDKRPQVFNTETLK